MPGEALRVRVVRFLQFWRNSVMMVVWRCCELVFGTLAHAQEQEQEQEQVQNCITRGSNDGETARPADGGWEDITTALNAEPCAPRELQISNNIDPAGEFKVPLGLTDEASQPTDAAATGPSAQFQIPPPRKSLEDFKELGIITAQRTPKPAIQDVKVGGEVLVVNTRHFPFLNTKPDQTEFLDQDHVHLSVDAQYDDLFRQFGQPELDNAAAGGVPVEAKPLKDSGHVPPFVSEGRVSTFAFDVDTTKTTLVPSLEKRRIAAGEVFANLDQTPPSTQKNQQMESDSSDALGQGSSSSSSM